MGDWGFGDIILLKSVVSVEIRGVTLSNYILNSRHDL
jgi:hypothetical protein